MTFMITELYDALKDAGADEDKARKAAESVTAYENRLADLASDFRVLKWGQAATFGMTIAILVKLFIQ